MFILFTNIIPFSAGVEENSTGLIEGQSFLYKNEHFPLDQHGNKMENGSITKWTKLVIDNISSSDDTTTIIWTKYDYVAPEGDDTLPDFEANPGLLEKDFSSPIPFGGIQLGVINKSEPKSQFQVMFNAKNATLEDVTPDFMIDGQFKIFYATELSYFLNSIESWGENNTIIKNELEANITKQTTRVFEASLSGESQIQLNDTYPSDSNAWYNSTLDLKLYLVYGKVSNILLSYNINFTITETYYDGETLNNQEDIQRKIIFWNIREPVELTEDYPLSEIFNFPSFNLDIISYIALGAIPVILIVIFRRKRK